MKPRYPSLFQINTRIWLRTLSENFNRCITLETVPEEELDRIAGWGFDWVWLLGVWATSPFGRKIALDLPGLRHEIEQLMPDYNDEDVCSSPFAITGYDVNPDLGGEQALTHLRERLSARGLNLMLDFIPNHTARDHPWVEEHPEYYIQGTPQDLVDQPQNYGYAPESDAIFAFGRDPNFPGWSDTFQLNYGEPALQVAMREELFKIAALCDGVRCDMAMLILPEIFSSTWGILMDPFWLQAIQDTRSKFPNFLFMAEVYWGLEWTLQHLGFNYTYDKRLYDRLSIQEARLIREHLLADMDFQNKSARFMENHDEPRAAAVFPPPVHRAAAVITYLVPGLRFFNQGQLEGYQSRIPMQLCTSPEDSVEESISDFYARLLDVLKSPVVRTGDWQLIKCQPAWIGNWTWGDFVAFAWQSETEKLLLVIVNFASHPSQCYLSVPLPGIEKQLVRFQDLIGDIEYLREGEEILQRGLYLDLPAWGFHVFQVECL